MRLAEKAKKKRAKLIATAKKAVAKSVGPDQLIVQAVDAIGDLEHAAHMLTRRLREWHGYYHPELDVRHVEKYLALVMAGEVRPEDSMGGDLKPADIDMIRSFAGSIRQLHEQRHHLEDYIEGQMKEYCPNLLELAGHAIGGKLLSKAGSLSRLSRMPASTVQMLGAEKALFRHLTRGAKPPKHGVIVQHPFIQGAPKKEWGKRARAFADKLSIAAKVDFFKGEPIAKKLQSDLDRRFG